MTKRFTTTELERVLRTYHEPDKELMLDIMDGIARLNIEEREAVVACGLFDLPFRSAAVRIGVSKDTVFRRYRRGVKNLVAYLGEDFQT